MRTIECQQGSPEWHAARCGFVTSSRIADLMSKVKSGESAGRRNYRAQIVSEILTGQPCENGFVSADMTRGTENEPLARAAYEVRTGEFLDTVGFVLHPTLDRCGASPDGLVGTDGLVEIKCPKTATHLDYLLGGTVPSEYQLEMLWAMECAERGWCDFVSFDPRLPEHLQLFVKRLVRDDERITAITAEVIKFWKEVEDILVRLPQGDDLVPILEASVKHVKETRGIATV